MNTRIVPFLSLAALVVACSGSPEPKPAPESKTEATAPTVEPIQDPIGIDAVGCQQVCCGMSETGGPCSCCGQPTPSPQKKPQRP